MNTVADLGGMMGFGPVRPEPEDERFHADWERRALALTLAAALPGGWTIDASRSARESLPPGEYLTSSYYAIWIKALERLLVGAGLVGADELAERRALRPGVPGPVLTAAAVPGVLATGSPAERPVDSPSRFAVGDRVRTRNVHPLGHTRLPRYARGKEGVIERVHGAHVLPDSNAHRAGEQPEWLYTVRFPGRELWGEAADPGLTVEIEAFESYLAGT
ncbi:nitrile hydratase subunit beta [Pseudonocardia sp. T1-2H]|uniref:nitrile hydratase subunit beta n=1 Tax=Pseudonocardia sp. T1-2H TaxID=3128899 RepID=UPI003100F4E5